MPGEDAALGSMSSLVSGALGYFSTRYAANKAAETAQKNREFQEKMADKQRAQALEDRAHAEMYNSPLMERLRREAAGLGPVDDYSTPATPSQGLAPDYAAATAGSSQPLVDAAMLGAQAPMVMMDRALNAAKTGAEILKDRAQASEHTASALVKNWNAKLQEMTLQDDILAKRLENDLTFQKTQNLIQEGANLVEQGKLTKTQRNLLESDLYVAQQTQEFKVEIAKQDMEQSKLRTEIDKKQLYEMMPKQLKVWDAEINRANAAANLANSQSRRINVLLPFEQKQLQENCTLLGLAVKSGTLDFDEQTVKHNKFMSHLKEYEDALVAGYKMSRQEANTYVMRTAVDMLGRCASTALMGAGVYKAFSAVPAVVSASKQLAGAGLIVPGTAAYEGALKHFGTDIPSMR